MISANQVTMWAALRRLGTRAVGPYQALLDASARVWPPGSPDTRVPRELPVPQESPVLPEEEQQEGWT